MSSTSTFPHWLQVAITIATVSIAAILAAQSDGQLALPMVAISVLSIVKLALGVLSDSWSTVKANKAAALMRASRGFVSMRTLFGVSGLGMIVALFTGANCTTQAVVAVAVQVAVDVCQEAPNLLPPDTTAGTIVALVCGVVDPKTGLPLKGQSQTVFVDAKQWNAAKLEYLQVHGHLPGGMSPAVKP